MGRLNRRTFLKSIGAAAAGYAAGGCSTGNMTAASKSPSAPNIIYVLVDDLGYGDLSCYGQKHFKTPNIDRLASQGMKFTNHYSGSTVCAPSRCTLMTGLHTGHCFIRGNFEMQPEGQLAMPKDTETVAKLLKRRGYKTGLIGKWGLGWPKSSGDPLNQGFDYFYGYNCQRHAHSYYPEYLWRNSQKEIIEGNLKGKTNVYSHDLLADDALKFVEENKSNPFFLYLALTIPHASMAVPEDSIKPFIGKFGEEKPYKSEGGYRNQPHPKAAFAGMVTRMDKDIGRLTSKLEELGIADNTVVIFTSDNGPHSEGGHVPAYFGSSGGLRGIKRDLYEGGIRVPFIAKWPGVIAAGTENPHISAFWDFLPTAAQIAGQPIAVRTDGISMLPALKGEKQPEHKYLYWEFRPRGTQAIRMRNWKAIKFIKDGRTELYNLDKDPTESNDLSKTYPDVTARMEQIMLKAHEPSDEFPLPFDL
ncbi:Arylsulfatase [Sedimentisphaera cyanobacteriorum]|uniref:Arylsulfatase n=1 Tax=Sedimentisphaera cyanobacteriorum TaxID=1940790 RepID=A0A1Q2HS33_9BACT|nr:arylsulfatase [Sedimentisphaera cyanobacteriorum]AQQ10045.1 Arylsulfatase [Sedimentisphaera cyanobacteriorum]